MKSNSKGGLDAQRCDSLQQLFFNHVKCADKAEKNMRNNITQNIEVKNPR